jgi:hypothetical protein
MSSLEQFVRKLLSEGLLRRERAPRISDGCGTFFLWQLFRFCIERHLGHEDVSESSRLMQNYENLIWPHQNEKKLRKIFQEHFSLSVLALFLNRRCGKPHVAGGRTNEAGERKKTEKSLYSFEPS